MVWRCFGYIQSSFDRGSRSTPASLTRARTAYACRLFTFPRYLLTRSGQGQEKRHDRQVAIWFRDMKKLILVLLTVGASRIPVFV